MNTKIKNIEFLRFLFALMIIYAHILWLCIYVFKLYSTFPFYKELFYNCNASFLCVEYFFIISGFFLFFNLKNKTDNTVNYAINKIIRLWPLLAFSIFLTFLFSLFKMCDFYSYANVLNLLFLYRTGIDSSPVNNMHSWFICSLFWCSIFYHYIYRNFNIKTVNLIIAIIVIYSYGAILSVNGGCIPGVHMKMISGVSGALLRGFASIGLGYFLGMFWNSISIYVQNFNITNKIKSIVYLIMVSAVEFYLFIFLINNSLFHKLSFKNNFIYIVVFSFLLLLFAAQKGILSRFLNNNLSLMLGKFSYSLYIMQAAGFVIARYFFWNNNEFVYSNPVWNIVLTMVICIVIALISHILIEVKVRKFLEDKINLLKNIPPPNTN